MRASQELKWLKSGKVRLSDARGWGRAEALFLRLGIPEQQQKNMLSVTNSETREEAWPRLRGCFLASVARAQEGGQQGALLQVEFSVSFPGLKTVYTIMEVRCEVLNPQDPNLQDRRLWMLACCCHVAKSKRQ